MYFNSSPLSLSSLTQFLKFSHYIRLWDYTTICNLFQSFLTFSLSSLLVTYIYCSYCTNYNFLLKTSSFIVVNVVSVFVFPTKYSYKIPLRILLFFNDVFKPPLQDIISLSWWLTKNFRKKDKKISFAEIELTRYLITVLIG